MALPAHIAAYCVDNKGDPVTPSHFQHAIFQTALNYNLLIQAVAGSGKSWTLKVLYRILEEKFGATTIVAFNFEIAKAMKDAGLNAKTLNGLGYASIMWQGPAVFGCTPTMDTNDVKIDEAIYTYIPKADLKAIGPGVKQMVQLARGMAAGTHMCVSQGLKPLHVTSRQFWTDLIDQYNIDFTNDNTDWNEDHDDEENAPVAPKSAFDAAEKILHRCNTQTSMVDFQDQKCFPVLYNLRMRRYKALLVDETQDMNDLDIELCVRSLASGGRFIAVGDRNQSIYSWRGADSRAMDRIASRFRCKELPLSICYRCPTSHIAIAKQFVPHIEARPGAPEGTVLRLKNYNQTAFPGGSVVICRMNAPLIKLAFRLMRKRVPVRVMGRDMSKGLVQLLIKIETAFKARRHLNPEQTELEYLNEGLIHWRNLQVKKAEAANKPKKVEAILDQFSVLELFAEEAEGETIQDVIAEIRKVLSTENNKSKDVITLSSIHRMKGGEADVIFILDTFLMPMKSATTDAEIQEERNLEYVANTRSRDTMVHIDSDGWKD